MGSESLLVEIATLQNSQRLKVMLYEDVVVIGFGRLQIRVSLEMLFGLAFDRW